MNKGLFKSSKFVFASVLIFGISSCQKVVSVDLNQANPQIVIEGLVNDTGGIDSVTVNMTGDYFTPSLSFPPVANAMVVISDNAGETDTLNEVQSGVYYSSNPKGVSGSTYSLKVVANGKEYDAVSLMPQKVDIDSFYSVKTTNPFGGESSYEFYVTFRDPSQQGNYYRIVPHDNAIPLDSLNGEGGGIHIYDDEFINGNEVSYEFRIGGHVNAGDTVSVDLLCIDKNVYEYLSTLRTTIETDRSPTSLAPANPNTNLTNGALGYFSAYTIDTRAIIIK
ncbi:MAG: DUF4249 domain-containing protein [Candidatus Kryptoniota bacterium]